MRDETRERFSDLAYSEAMHDDVVEEVVALQVEVGKFGGQPLNGETSTTKWEPAVVSPALSYLLFDELRIGDPGKGFAGDVLVRIRFREPDIAGDADARERALEALAQAE